MKTASPRIVPFETKMLKGLTSIHLEAFADIGQTAKLAAEVFETPESQTFVAVGGASAKVLGYAQIAKRGTKI